MTTTRQQRIASFFKFITKLFSFKLFSDTMEIQPQPNIDLHILLLSSGLNEDCFVEILKYLSVCDLLKICEFDTETSKTFTELIRQHIMPLKLFDFDEIQSQQRTWSIVKLFETFGPSMRRLKVSAWHIRLTICNSITITTLDWNVILLLRISFN